MYYLKIPLRYLSVPNNEAERIVFQRQVEGILSHLRKSNYIESWCVSCDDLDKVKVQYEQEKES